MIALFASGARLPHQAVNYGLRTQKASEPMSKNDKKRYLKALNWRLKKESTGKFDTVFVFDPPGSKPKDATGVTVSGPASDEILAVMNAVQARVFAKYKDSAKLG